jgi:hypothetical protein
MPWYSDAIKNDLKATQPQILVGFKVIISRDTHIKPPLNNKLFIISFHMLFGPDVDQKGSNVNLKRLYSRKLQKITLHLCETLITEL